MVTDTMAKDDMYKFAAVLSELGRGYIQVTGPRIKTTENTARASGRPVIYIAVTPAVDQIGICLSGREPVFGERSLISEKGACLTG